MRRLVSQKYFEDMSQLLRSAFDGAGADVDEQFLKQLLARLARGVDPGRGEIAQLGEALSGQCALAGAGRAAQEQAIDLLVDQILELESRVPHRVRGEHRPRRVGSERVAF